MASLQEIFEEEPQAKRTPKFLNAIETPNTESRSNDETPIFKTHKMDRISQQHTEDIIHSTVSNRWLFCVRSSPAHTTLYRQFLPRAAIVPTEIALEKYLPGYRISKLFVDHTGHHLLVSLVPKTPGLSADFLYVNGSSIKMRRIEKFKDHEITSVAFNRFAGTETSTAPILLATSRGLIFETELTQDAEKPLYRKQVYDLGLGRPKYPIIGIELLHSSSTNKYIVVAAAIDCIYTFQESFKPEDKFSLQNIFAPYVNGLRIPLVIEERSDLNHSVLCCFGQPNEKQPTQWGWLCGTGILTGEICYTAGNDDQVLVSRNLISLDFDQKTHLSYEERRLNVPHSFVLTEYHALLLYSDHITGICLLNHEIVYQEHFHERFGRFLNIVRDVYTGSIYVLAEKAIFTLSVNEEKRNIWNIYLQKGDFDMAERFASDNPFLLDTVLEKKADMAFIEKNYELAATTYASTEKSFEEICLKFITLDDKHPIILYIKKRLELLKDPERITVLVLWLLDLYMTEINSPGSSKEQRLLWQSEFDEFMQLPQVSSCVRTNYEMVYELISEHADTHNLSQIAIANNDYEAVVEQHFNNKNYAAALAALGSQKDPELFYKYCPILMEEMPHETAELLKSQGRKLRVDRLVPTLIAIESPKHIEEIMKYLEHAIYNLDERNQAAHNFLLRLYAEHKPDKLIAYLVNEGQDVSLVHYEINYALSVCMELKANAACVFLQCLLEMWSSAVELALSFNVQLAKETASKPKDSDLRRKLWLRIAHHDIKDTNDVSKALDMLKQCDLLSIEDLLPLFSDFEKIDDFKQPICFALKEYNQKIQELQHDMEESSKQADRVRSELQSIRDGCVRIAAQEPCAICESYLLVKPFFVFPCGHKFHSDCLEKQITPMLSSDKSRNLTMLKQQLESMLTQSVAMAAVYGSQEKRKKIKSEVEQILASNCLYCEHMIDTIDQPFCEDWDQVNVDWE